jgi:hypothetical protein
VQPRPSSRRSREEILGDLRWSYRWTRFFIVWYAGIATVVYLVGTGAGEEPILGLPAIFLLYSTAGLVTGTLIGLLRPFASRSMRGAMAVGFVATLPVYFGGFIAVEGLRALLDVPADIGLVIGATCFGMMAGRLCFKRSR